MSEIHGLGDMIILGLSAFLLLFLSDLNDLSFHKRRLIFLFPLGAVMLVIACVFSLDFGRAAVSGPFWRVFFWILFAFFTALEIHSLFFALPASESYVRPGERRKVCKSGVYSLCRHPGVLWLGAAMLCLSLCAGLPLIHTLIYSLLNLALALFEDLIVFPRLMEGYEAYKRETPFLIPGPASVKAFLRGGKKPD